MPVRKLLHFGPFTVDRDLRELRRDGSVIPLQDLPFRMLLELLERPGEIVSRAALEKALWPDGTVVHFEHGLNTAVKKLRDALDDSSTNPKYIQTVARRGYRFVGTLDQPATEKTEVDALIRVHETRKMMKPRWRWIVAGGLATLAAAVAALIFRDAAPQSTPVPIRLADQSGVTLHASVSRNGELVAFSSDGGAGEQMDIWLTTGSGGQPRRVTTDAADDFSPSMSPDGKTIAFQSQRDPAGIYVIDALGGSERLVMLGGERPVFSPTGQTLAVAVDIRARNPVARQPGVYLLPAVGGEPVLVSKGLERALDPAWIDDRRLIVLGMVGQEAEVYVLDTDLSAAPLRTGILKLLRSDRLRSRGSFIWSATRSELIITADHQGTVGLWRLPVDGRTFQPKGSPVPLPTGATLAFGPAVTASGEVFFCAGMVTADLWRFAANGHGELEQLTSTAQITTASHPLIAMASVRFEQST
jgi:DNA-binding winged helix-turn-helix (wHTH) protein